MSSTLIGETLSSKFQNNSSFIYLFLYLLSIKNIINLVKQILLETSVINEKIDVSQLDVKKIKPTQKDDERAEGLRWDSSFGKRRFFGNNAPIPHNVVKMAQSIKDPEKLVRRTKAVLNLYGVGKQIGLSNGGQRQHISEPWEEFKKALKRLGFTGQQIEDIRKSA